MGCLYIGAILTATASGITVGPNTCCQISILRHLIAVETSRFLSQVIPYMYQNTNFGIGISMLRGFTSNLSGSETIQHLRKKASIMNLRLLAPSLSVFRSENKNEMEFFDSRTLRKYLICGTIIVL